MYQYVVLETRRAHLIWHLCFYQIFIVRNAFPMFVVKPGNSTNSIYKMILICDIIWQTSKNLILEFKFN